jgi:hypothetical protein
MKLECFSPNSSNSRKSGMIRESITQVGALPSHMKTASQSDSVSRQKSSQLLFHLQVLIGCDEKGLNDQAETEFAAVLPLSAVDNKASSPSMGSTERANTECK